MRISFKWLKKYVELNTSPEDIAASLTGIGLEVESIDYLGKKYDGFVVGHVVDVQMHPNADRLSICKVLVAENEEPKQVVCGAPNVTIGQKVIIGLPGATVPKNQHDPNGKPFVLTKAKIRGIESNGMICSESELGLGEDSSGIVVLDSAILVGLPLSEYLGLNDTAMEIGVTPNRPDCLSHIGIARDLAAHYGRVLKKPDCSIANVSARSVHDLISVEIKNTVSCPRYSARAIVGVKIQDSPEWLQHRLTAVGIRPINNVVDITNFVMMEYGQPLHAFDLDRLSMKKIIVKNAETGEKFQTLDGKMHNLSGSELMICDGERSVAIGGVMGGMNSEISVETTNVVLECAYFDPVSIRRTSKKLGISTDASYRFERSTDPNMVDEASRRAALLIVEIAGGELLDGAIDVYPSVIENKKISLRYSRVTGILGVSIPNETILAILTSIDISAKILDNDTIECSIPTFRPDIEQEIDLIEEVARMFGYDNIPDKTSGEVVFSEPSGIEQRLNDLMVWLQSNGCNEVVTNSMIDESTARIFTDKVVKVINPLSVELEVMRPKLLPSLLESVSYNLNHGADRIRFFELGNGFETTDSKQNSSSIDGISEKKYLGMVFSGFTGMLSWHEKQREFDIFDIKGVVFSLLKSVGIDNIHFIYYDALTSLTEQTMGVEINNTYAGYIGKCSEQLMKKYKVDRSVFYAELELDVIFSIPIKKKYTEFSKYPTVVRDVAFIVDEKIPVAEIEKSIFEAGGVLISGITLFDVFYGKHVGIGKKSVAFSLSVNSFEHTLKDIEVDDVIDKIVQAVIVRHSATLRSK